MYTSVRNERCVQWQGWPEVTVHTASEQQPVRVWGDYKGYYDKQLVTAFSLMNREYNLFRFDLKSLYYLEYESNVKLDNQTRNALNSRSCLFKETFSLVFGSDAMMLWHKTPLNVSFVWLISPLSCFLIKDIYITPSLIIQLLVFKNMTNWILLCFSYAEQPCEICLHPNTNPTYKHNHIIILIMSKDYLDIHNLF